MVGHPSTAVDALASDRQQFALKFSRNKVLRTPCTEQLKSGPWPLKCRSRMPHNASLQRAVIHTYTYLSRTEAVSELNPPKYFE